MQLLLPIALGIVDAQADAPLGGQLHGAPGDADDSAARSLGQGLGVRALDQSPVFQGGEVRFGIGEAGREISAGGAALRLLAEEAEQVEGFTGEEQIFSKHNGALLRMWDAAMIPRQTEEGNGMDIYEALAYARRELRKVQEDTAKAAKAGAPALDRKNLEKKAAYRLYVARLLELLVEKLEEERHG